MSVDIKKVFEYYEKDRKYAVSFEKFYEAGWSKKTCLLYLQCVEQLRSAVILLVQSQYSLAYDNFLKKFNGKTNIYKDIIDASIDNLKYFLEQTTGQEWEIESLKSFYKNFPHIYSRYYVSMDLYLLDDCEDLCGYIYLSVDEFRKVLEEKVYSAIKKKKATLSLSGIDINEDNYSFEKLSKLKEEFYSIEQEYGLDEVKEINIKDYNSIQRSASIQEVYISCRDDINDIIESLETAIEDKHNKEYKDEYTLYVCAGLIRCQKDHHNVICVNAHLNTVEDMDVVLNVNYCKDCNLFFISKDEYDEYKKEYPGLIANFKFVSLNEELGNIFDNMEEFSVLALNGYNVRKDGPDHLTRCKILSRVMEKGIMSKSEIIQHINGLIDTRRMQSKMQSAVCKWREDLDFVRNFEIDNQENYNINKVEKYRK